MTHSPLISLWPPARLTRHPAGRRAPARAPVDDRGDRPPRTRDVRRPPNLQLPPPRLPLHRPSVKPCRPPEPEARPCMTRPAARPPAERSSGPTCLTHAHPDLLPLPRCPAAPSLDCSEQGPLPRG